MLTDYKGKTYYFKSDGAAYKGMKRVDGKYYWFHTTQDIYTKQKKWSEVPEIFIILEVMAYAVKME